MKRKHNYQSVDFFPHILAMTSVAFVGACGSSKAKPQQIVSVKSILAPQPLDTSKFKDAAVKQDTAAFQALELQGASDFKFAVASAAGFVLHNGSGLAEKLDGEGNLSPLKFVDERESESCPGNCYFNSSESVWWQLKDADIRTLGQVDTQAQKRDLLSLAVPPGVKISTTSAGMLAFLGAGENYLAFKLDDTDILYAKKENNAIELFRLQLDPKIFQGEKFLAFQMNSKDQSILLLTQTRVLMGANKGNNVYAWSVASKHSAEAAKSLASAQWASMKLNSDDANAKTDLIYSDGSKIYKLEKSSKGVGPKEFTPELLALAKSACGECHVGSRVGFTDAHKATSWLAVPSMTAMIVDRLEKNTMPPTYAPNFSQFKDSDRLALLNWIRSSTNVIAGSSPTLPNPSPTPDNTAAKKAAQTQIFTTKVKPLLTSFCVGCHSTIENETDFRNNRLGKSLASSGRGSVVSGSMPDGTPPASYTAAKKAELISAFQDYAKAGE